MLQFYWIRETIQANNEAFSQKIYDVLKHVSEKVEKQEALYAIQQKFGENYEVVKNDVEVSYDSLGNPHWTEEQKIRYTKLFGTNETNQSGLVYQIEEETTLKKEGSAKRKKVSISEADGMRIQTSDANTQIPGIDTSQLKSNNSMIQLKKLAKKTDMVAYVVNEMMHQNKKSNIRDRISPRRLDSLLRSEIQQRGINIPFQYVVQNGIGNQAKLYFNHTTGNEQDVVENGYKTKLFPNDIVDRNTTLFIHFPHRGRFVLSEIWVVLCSSAIFIILIILCFYLAVRMIFQQKKLSDITNDFISNMTHELKTPVSTVSLACEALMDPDVAKIPSIHQRYMKIIKDESMRLALQIERVLQIARMDKGDLRLNIIEVNMHEVIDEAVNSIGLKIEHRSGELTVDKNAENPILQGDKVHLTNIIHNLLDNANKYTDKTPKITITTHNTSYGLMIKISDNGRGIASEHINKIFDKFFRVPTGNVHNVKGFGLGLSYVHSMVEAHQGNIEVKSQLKKGTAFTIFFPFTQQIST